MAKQENFDFDTESNGKGKFDLIGFFKNLTKKQKGIIIGATIGVLALVVIVICVVAFSSGLGGLLEKNPEHAEMISDVYVSSMPRKNTYNIGEEPDYSGLTLGIINYNLDTIYVSYDKDPEDFEITGFDSSVPVENQVITVSYKGFTTSFKIDIKPDPNAELHIVKIELSSMPKTEYKVGDYPSFKNGMIRCTYSDGTIKEEKLTFAHTTGFEKAVAPGEHTVSIPGEYTIRVQYKDGDFCETITYTITVTE